jgi:hypothetical protein
MATRSHDSVRMEAGRGGAGAGAGKRAGRAPERAR